jgi:NADPH:quinone reductase-like Zn-dependent oxidoreductase
VDDMLQAVAVGRIRVVIDRVFPLANAAEAHEYAETAKPLGRIVMKP